MKTKIATLSLLFGVSMIASAVTISWSGSAATASVKGLTSGAAMTYGTGSQTASMIMYYFNYADYDEIIGLGKVDASALASYVVASAEGVVQDKDTSAGRVKGSTKNTDYEEAGVSFFARAYATFDNTTYFINLFGGTGNDVWTLSSSGDDRTTQSFKWENATYGGATATSAGARNAWVAVPEPSVALLGLLGLGMLLKRRRA